MSDPLVVIEQHAGMIETSLQPQESTRRVCASEHVRRQSTEALTYSPVALHTSTIAEILEQFAHDMRLDVADGNASPETLRAYWTDAHEHLQWLCERGSSPALADEDTLKEYRAHLVGKYATSTAGRKFTSVRRFYEIAFVRGQIPQNPAAVVKSPRANTGEHDTVKWISPDRLQQLLRLTDPEMALTAHEKLKRLRDRTMLLLMMRHGLRVIEVARLNMTDLDLQVDAEASSVRVLGRRSQGRTLHLVAQTQTALEQWMAARRLMHVEADATGEPLFVSMHWADNGHGKGGKRMTTRGIRLVVDGYLEASGAKKEGISCHALRHSFATWALYFGADLRSVSGEMGQASNETATKYGRVVDAIRANPAKYLTFLESPLPDSGKSEPAVKPRRKKAVRRKQSA